MGPGGELRLDREKMMEFVAALSSSCQGEYIQGADGVSEECWDDVWYEIDFNETGFITWHQVKGMLKQLTDHEAELEEQRRIAEEERLRKEEEERLAMEEEILRRQKAQADEGEEGEAMDDDEG